MPTQRNYGVNQQLERIANAILASHAASTAAQLDAMWSAILNGENTSLVFPKWWKLAKDLDNDTSNRYAILARFFEMLADAWGDKVYTLRGPDYRTNSTGVTTLTPLADLADKTAAGVYTETDNPAWHWTDDDPMLWYVRANALSLSAVPVDAHLVMVLARLVARMVYGRGLRVQDMGDEAARRNEAARLRRCSGRNAPAYDMARNVRRQPDYKG